MAVSSSELRRRGYSAEEISLAKATQDAARRAGAPARSLAEILAGQPARGRPGAAVVDLTARQLRRRGGYGQAALLADQAALAETDPEKASLARFHAAGLAALGRAKQLEFDFFGGGNVSLGHQYIDAVQSRLLETKATPAERDAALATLLLITRHMEWQVHTCAKSAAELAALRGVKTSHISTTLALLESVGAISRVKRGQRKIIMVTPEGVFRGDLSKHGEAVAAYSAAVVPLHKDRKPPKG
jgi:hypothetical protein